MSTDVVPAKACAKTQFFKLLLGSQPYEVIWNGHDWHCQCKGFEYRGTCKHVNEAQSQHCIWGLCNEGVCFDGTTCPSCGGPLIDIRVAI